MTQTARDEPIGKSHYPLSNIRRGFAVSLLPSKQQKYPNLGTLDGLFPRCWQLTELNTCRLLVSLQVMVFGFTHFLNQEKQAPPLPQVARSAVGSLTGISETVFVSDGRSLKLGVVA